jgi:hypothetical protein
MVSAETTYLTKRSDIYNFVKNYAGTNEDLNNDLAYMCDNAIPVAGTSIVKHIVTTDGTTTRSRCVTSRTYQVWSSYYQKYITYTVFSTVWDLKYTGTEAPRTVTMWGCNPTGYCGTMLTAKVPLPL